MKINLRKLAAAIVTTAKKNPALVVAVATAVAPKVAAKWGPLIISSTAKK